jgi:hypothetical protein
VYSNTGAVDIMVYKQGYVPFTSIRNYNLSTTDTVLPPVRQIPDRNFLT